MNTELVLLGDTVIAELREVMEDEFDDLINGFLNDLLQQLHLLETAVGQESAGEVYRIALNSNPVVARSVRGGMLIACCNWNRRDVSVP